MDQSPAAMGKSRGKGQRRPRKPKPPAGQVPVNPMAMNQNQMGHQSGMPMQGVPGGPGSQMSHMGVYGQGPASLQQQQGQQFGNTGPGQQQWYSQQQQQTGYYPQQMANGKKLDIKKNKLQVFLFS